MDKPTQSFEWSTTVRYNWPGANGNFVSLGEEVESLRMTYLCGETRGECCRDLSLFSNLLP